MQNHHVSLDRLNIILNNHVISKKQSLEVIKEETLYKKVNTALKQS